MLRFAIALSLSFTAASFAAPVPKEKVSADGEAILGQWILTDVKLAGEAMANEAGLEQTATIDQTHMSVTSGSSPAQKTGYKLDTTKKHIDLLPKTPGEKPMKGVYEFVGDTLRIAISFDGDRERPKEAKAGPGNIYFEFQRSKEEKK